MASVSAPAPPARNSDNVRSGDRGAPTRAVNRGRGGARNGPSRRRGGAAGVAAGGGGNTRSGGGQGASAAPASTANKPELKVTTTAAATNNKTASVAKPSPASARPGRRNGNLPQAAAPKTPASNVTPASPNVDKAATTPKRPRNDRRPRTKAPGPPKAGNGDAVTPKSVNGKSTATPEPVAPVIEISKDAPPHVASESAPVVEVTKDAPPHLAAPAADKPNMTIKTSGIDSLVDHVRHMAMERPITPGSASHIDWAGDDEDDTLPDLDDWGVPSASTTSTGGLDKLMSPILDDSIKQLPIHVKTPLLTASGLSPSIGSLKDEFKTEKSPTAKAPPPAIDVTSSLDTSPSAPSSLAATAKGPHNSIGTDVSALNTSHSDSSIPVTPQTAPPFNATHARSRTLGRPPNSGMGAGIPHRPFHSGSGTPRDGTQARHGRTQSTPPSAGGPARHSRQGSRPVIAGTALAQIARTLGGGGSALKREAVTVAAAPP